MDLLNDIRNKITNLQSVSEQQSNPRMKSYYLEIINRLEYWLRLVNSESGEVGDLIIKHLSSRDFDQANPEEVCLEILQTYFPVNNFDTWGLQTSSDEKLKIGNKNQFHKPELQLEWLQKFCSWLESGGYLKDNKPTKNLEYLRGKANKKV